MQILLALIYGGCVGALAHFTMPSRDTRGPALAPMIGAVVAGVLWTALTWAGLGVDDPWLWVLSVLVPAAAVYAAVALLTRLRHAHDAHERARLNITA